MKTTRLVAVLVGLAVIVTFAAEASAFYHPGLGRWMSRDPDTGGGDATRLGGGGPAVAGSFLPRDQYADGMSLYEYVRSNPCNGLDAWGLKADDERNKLEISAKRQHWSGTVELKAWGLNIPLYANPFVPLYLPISPFASFATEETIGGSGSEVSFAASLRVTVWKPFESWEYQVCPQRGWKVTIKNVCCVSGNIKLTATKQDADPAAVARVPDSGTYEIRKGAVQDFDVLLSVVFTWPGHNTKGWPKKGWKTVETSLDMRAECED